MTVEKKRCQRCKGLFPVEQFAYDRRYVDGRNSWCDECHRRYTASYLKQHPTRAGGYDVRTETNNLIKAELQRRGLTMNEQYRREIADRVLASSPSKTLPMRVVEQVEAKIRQVSESLRRQRFEAANRDLLAALTAALNGVERAQELAIGRDDVLSHLEKAQQHLDAVRVIATDATRTILEQPAAHPKTRTIPVRAAH